MDIFLIFKNVKINGNVILIYLFVHNGPIKKFMFKHWLLLHVQQQLFQKKFYVKM